MIENITIFGKDGGAEREEYALFLDEASSLLSNSALKDIAQQFRSSAKAWDKLAKTLLPDDVPLLKETRELMLDKHQLFLNKGNAALPEIHQKNERLDEIKSQVSEQFPLNNTEAADLNASVRERVLEIHDIELKAIENLQTAMEQFPE